MRIIGLFLMLTVCSCQSSKPSRNTASVTESALEAIAQVMDESYSPKEATIVFSPEQREHLKAVTFSDPLSMDHPRYFDKIRSIQQFQVERFYLNYTGEVSRSEIVVLPEAAFWEPLRVLAEYYSKFRRLPIGTTLSVSVLKGALAQKPER